ncbi:hypothetical protein [Candidatus Marinarcus aquaticus]|uniref:DNA-binding protein n=1 Tax=Candidatus Marinarcus aquaticus TaxID=2044504 RepID=A0A4V1LP22_9BACT|nr:hypothetical protein [Candidatus Marinarcus aquaticus]RXJ58010.1 hypothetical protein CRV04_05760 [Candidatus Marinarcus aquaticus]
MTFIDFKKLLLDAEITLPKFANLIKVNEKNIQAYKKKEEVPNAIAVIAQCFATMQEHNIDYKELIKNLELQKKEKKGAGFSKKKKKEDK